MFSFPGSSFYGNVHNLKCNGSVSSSSSTAIHQIQRICLLLSISCVLLKFWKDHDLSCLIFKLFFFFLNQIPMACHMIKAMKFILVIQLRCAVSLKIHFFLSCLLKEVKITGFSISFVIYQKLHEKNHLSSFEIKC